MKKFSSCLSLSICTLAGLLLMSQSFFAEDGVAGDFRNPQRGASSGLDFKDLINLSAATMMQEAPEGMEEEEDDLLLSGWTFGGFLEVAYSYNFNQPAGAESPIFSPPAPVPVPNQRAIDVFGNANSNVVDKENNFRIFDTEHNDFSVPHLQLHAEKQFNEWLSIFSKAMVGQDAKYIHSTGLNEGDDFDLMDAYIQIRIPDDVIKSPFMKNATLTVGKFETMYGAEVISAPENWNYSRSYLFGYAIPFTHTGLFYSQSIMTGDSGDEIVGAKLGIVNGWDNVRDDNQGKSVMLGLAFTPCSWFDISVGGMIGNEQDDDDHDRRGLIDIVSNVKIPEEILTEDSEFLKNLSFLLNYDYGAEEFTDAADAIDSNRDGVTDSRGRYSKWYGFSGIVKYDFTKYLYLAFRGEVFDDPEGVRTGAETTFMELTTTLGYRPWDNLLVRMEYRYDKAGENVFEDHSDLDENHQNTIAFETVLTF